MLAVSCLIKSTRREDLEPSSEQHNEIIVIETTIDKLGKCFIIVYYRPPNDTNHLCAENLGNALHNISITGEKKLIVMGDFNMESQNPAMRWLNRIGIGKPRLASTDVWQSIHPNRTIGTRHGFNGSLSGPQIDHIRLSSNLQALDARIDTHSRNGRYPSDHFPVVAKIRLTGAGYDRRATVAAQVPNTNSGRTATPLGTL